MPKMNETKYIPLKNDLEKTHHGAPPNLRRVLDAYHKLQGKYKAFECTDLQNSYWHAEHFNLHRSTLFAKATPKEQQQILARCSENLIKEAYFVEKSAFAYCAKMMLLAQTTEIAEVYSMIANEEAIHMAWIAPYVAIEQRHQAKGEFFQFLSYLIEECDCNLLPYLVQVILEGWGLRHYKLLAQGCQHAKLKGIFHDIARDEALHTHTGEVVFSSLKVSASQFAFIEESLKTFTHMGRAGPVDLLTVIDEEMGGIDKAAKRLLLEETCAHAETVQKLALLKKLMLQPGVESIVQKLEREGYFNACS